MELRCVVQGITYASENFSVVRVKCNNDYFSATGAFGEVYEGMELLLKGDFVTHTRYGQQFKVTSIQMVLPKTKEGIKAYLAGMVTGIGAKYAEKIVNAFGTATLEIINNNPKQLLTVKGVPKNKLKKVIENWQDNKSEQEAFVFLTGIGVSPTIAKKIYKCYGDNTINAIRSNPYRLADDIYGIAFPSADKITQSMGVPKDSKFRIKAGIIYVLKMLGMSQGHVFEYYDQLLNECSDILECDVEKIECVLKTMKDDIVIDSDRVYTTRNYHREQYIADKIKLLMKDKWVIPCSNIDEKYDNLQVEAIKKSCESQFMVLTGGPGTGKTTTVNGIVKAFEKYDVIAAAPTGKAAKRMSEATGLDAKTIHRLLEYGGEGFQRNENNPLEGDVLIIDECSMIDNDLMYCLLSAVNEHMKVIMVGDIDQLPSVGAGNILRDIIASDVVPVVKLTKIFRQAQQSDIIMNAHRINQGVMPVLDSKKDFIFIECDNAQQASDQIVNKVVELTKQYSPNDIQVLSPMKKTDAGTNALNVRLKAVLNPGGLEVKFGEGSFRIGDTVMQIKNNYDKGVFNGDSGKVTDIVTNDKNEKFLVVEFEGKRINYSMDELNQIVLSYATTIHKSQGSEYPVVIMPIISSFYIMLQRNLVYTGITRAKKLCIVIGTKQSLAYAIKHNTIAKRNTYLKERLGK